MNNNHGIASFRLVLISQLIIVLLGSLAMWTLAVPIPPGFGSWHSSLLLGILLALLTFVAFFVIYRVGGMFANTLLADLQKVSDLFIGYSWWRIAVVATLAGVGEELLFRGFLQVWLGQYMSIGWAILLASIVFGLLHYLSHAYFICTLLMSIIFGIVYFWTDNLLMLVVWHGVYDFIVLGILIKFPQLIELNGRK